MRRIVTVQSILAQAKQVLGHEWDDQGVRRQVKRHAEAHVGDLKLLDKLKAGPPRQVRSHQKHVLQSESGRICAMTRAAARKGIKLDFTSVEVAAQAARLLGWDEPVRLRLVEKANGGQRPTRAYGFRKTADQLLVGDVLRVVLRTSEHDYVLNGRGAHGAVTELTNQINQEERRWLYTADIANCFGSFANDGVVKYLPLPEAIVRRVILDEDCHFLGETAPKNSPSFISAPPLQSGLPPGSLLSNMVAGALLKSVFDNLAADYSAVGYADDFGVACYSWEEGQAVHQALTAQLEEHPAGDLRLGRHSVDSACSDQAFLGYRFIQLSDDQVGAQPKRQAVLAFIDRLCERIDCLDAPDLDDLVLQKVKDWSKSYKAWDLLGQIQDCGMTEIEMLALSAAQLETIRLSSPGLCSTAHVEEPQDTPPWA